MAEQAAESLRKAKEIRDAADPLIKYLCENYHPNVTAIVTGTGIEILETIANLPQIYDFLDPTD